PATFSDRRAWQEKERKTRRGEPAGKLNPLQCNVALPVSSPIGQARPMVTKVGELYVGLGSRSTCAASPANIRFAIQEMQKAQAQRGLSKARWWDIPQAR